MRLEKKSKHVQKFNKCNMYLSTCTPITGESFNKLHMQKIYNIYKISNQRERVSKSET